MNDFIEKQSLLSTKLIIYVCIVMFALNTNFQQQQPKVANLKKHFAKRLARCHAIFSLMKYKLLDSKNHMHS